MAKTAAIVIMIILVISCTKETFKNEDTTLFNKSIAGKMDIKNAQELMELYYNYPEEEGAAELSIVSKKMRKNRIEVMLLHDRLADDSMRAIKIIMIAKKSGNHWIALEIKKNWKCYDGRGHTTWGVEPCR